MNILKNYLWGSRQHEKGENTGEEVDETYIIEKNLEEAIKKDKNKESSRK